MNLNQGDIWEASCSLWDDVTAMSLWFGSKYTKITTPPTTINRIQWWSRAMLSLNHPSAPFCSMCLWTKYAEFNSWSDFQCIGPKSLRGLAWILVGGHSCDHLKEIPSLFAAPTRCNSTDAAVEMRRILGDTLMNATQIGNLEKTMTRFDMKWNEKGNEMKWNAMKWNEIIWNKMKLYEMK